MREKKNWKALNMQTINFRWSHKVDRSVFFCWCVNSYRYAFFSLSLTLYFFIKFLFLCSLLPFASWFSILDSWFSRDVFFLLLFCWVHCYWNSWLLLLILLDIFAVLIESLCRCLSRSMSPFLDVLLPLFDRQQLENSTWVTDSLSCLSVKMR